MREWIIQTTGFLGRLFPTRLYHPALAGTPPEEGNWNHFGGAVQGVGAVASAGCFASGLRIVFLAVWSAFAAG